MNLPLLSLGVALGFGAGLMYLILLRPHGCLWAIHRSRAAQGSGERELWTSLLPIERAWAFLCPVFAAIAALACLVAVLQAAV